MTFGIGADGPGLGLEWKRKEPGETRLEAILKGCAGSLSRSMLRREGGAPRLRTARESSTWLSEHLTLFYYLAEHSLFDIHFSDHCISVLI